MSIPAVSKLKGTGYNRITMPTLNPQQMELFNQLYGGSKQGIGAGLDQLTQQAQGTPDYWKQLEAPALRQFGELQGNIASRFSGMGSGARRSSGFQNTLGGASADLAERLQAQRTGLQQNAISQLLGIGNQLLGTSTFENSLIPKQKPWWQELISSAVPGISQGLGTAGSFGAMKKFGLLG